MGSRQMTDLKVGEIVFYVGVEGSGPAEVTSVSFGGVQGRWTSNTQYEYIIIQDLDAIFKVDELSKLDRVYYGV